MSNFQFTAETLRAHVAANIRSMSLEVESYQDIREAIIEALEENHYDDAPSVDYIHEAWDIIGSDLWRNTHIDSLDFSHCESAFDAVFHEAREVIYAAHHEAMQELAQDIADTLEDVFSQDFGNKELPSLMIGTSGLGHTPHNEEIDVGDASLLVWDNRVQVTIEGVTWYGVLRTVE